MEYFANISEAVENAGFHKMTEITCKWRADATLQQFDDNSSESWCVRLICNTEQLILGAKHLIIP